MPCTTILFKVINTIDIAVQGNNYLLVFSAFLIRSFNIKFFLYIVYFLVFSVYGFTFSSSDFFRNIFYFISNRDATSDPIAAAFFGFRKERELLISSRLDLWLWVIFIDDCVISSPARG